MINVGRTQKHQLTRSSKNRKNCFNLCITEGQTDTTNKNVSLKDFTRLKRMRKRCRAKVIGLERSRKDCSRGRVYISLRIQEREQKFWNLDCCSTSLCESSTWKHYFAERDKHSSLVLLRKQSKQRVWWSETAGSPCSAACLSALTIGEEGLWSVTVLVSFSCWSRDNPAAMSLGTKSVSCKTSTDLHY